jgi:hypothetical protein
VYFSVLPGVYFVLHTMCYFVKGTFYTSLKKYSNVISYICALKCNRVHLEMKKIMHIKSVRNTEMCKVTKKQAFLHGPCQPDSCRCWSILSSLFFLVSGTFENMPLASTTPVSKLDKKKIKMDTLCRHIAPLAILWVLLWRGIQQPLYVKQEGHIARGGHVWGYGLTFGPTY